MVEHSPLRSPCTQHKPPAAHSAPCFKVTDIHKMQWEYGHKYLPICLVTHKTLPSNSAGSFFFFFVAYTKKAY